MEMEHLFQAMKMVECVTLLVTWTSVTDEYQNEFTNIDGRLMKLSILIAVAVVAWIFTVLWLVLTFTKVYSFLKITASTNTAVHTILAALILTSSLLLVLHQRGTKHLAERPGGCLGIVCGALLLVDAMLFVVFRKPATSDGFIAFS